MRHTAWRQHDIRSHPTPHIPDFHHFLCIDLEDREVEVGRREAHFGALCPGMFNLHPLCLGHDHCDLVTDDLGQSLDPIAAHPVAPFDEGADLDDKTTKFRLETM